MPGESEHTANNMQLRLMLPTEVLIDEPVVKGIAEAYNGEFCLLPRHIDFTAALPPGVLRFFTADGEESFAAIDSGVLVKCGQDVLVSTINGVRCADLGQLQGLVEARFLTLDDAERKARAALARLEAGTLRRFRDLQEKLHD